MEMPIDQERNKKGTQVLFLCQSFVVVAGYKEHSKKNLINNKNWSEQQSICWGQYLQHKKEKKKKITWNHNIHLN